MKVTKAIIVLILALLAVIPLSAQAAVPAPDMHGVQAQAGGSVTYDAPVEGTITPEAVQQDWTFAAEGADRIAVQVDRLDGNLIPQVQVLDSAGTVLADSYRSDETYAAAEIDGFTLPQAASYTIRVLRVNGPDGVTSGMYRLSVTPLGVGETHPNNTAPLGDILYDAPASGEITPLHWWHLYSFTGDEGDLVVLSARRVSGTLIPEVILLDNNGQELTHGYPIRGNDAAETGAYTLGYSGTYQAVVARAQGAGGMTAGQYDFALALLGSGETSARLTGVTPSALEQYNAPVQGTITHANWYQDWQFRTLAADTVTVVVRRTEADPGVENNLRPQLVLKDSAGQDLTYGFVDYDGATARIERYDMPGAGTFTVRVVREGDRTGSTVGMYELTVMLHGAGEGSEHLLVPAGAVTAGTPATGELSAYQWMQVWTYSGQEGETIDITATRATGTLVPYIYLRDSNGADLGGGYPDRTMDVVALTGRTLPYTGDYLIVVSREQDQRGWTAGGYTLTVGPAAP